MEFYDELGLNKNATEDDIKKAYRKLAMIYHPDKASEDNKDEYTKRFQKISEAYEVLSDNEKRKIYDNFGKEGLKPQMQAQAPDIFNGIFKNFFQQPSPQTPMTRKNGDTIFRMDLSLKEVYCGATRKIKVARQIIVNSKGDPVAPNETTSKICPDCNGLGFTIKGIRSGAMFQQFQQQCAKCLGIGFCLLENYKIQEKSEILTVDVPRGSGNGGQHRFGERGHQAPGVIAGDIVVVFNHLPFGLGFSRNGSDLEYTHLISLKDALCGGILKVILPDENTIDINYSCIQMKEGITEKKILPKLGFNGGNLVVIFKITFPTLNEKQKEEIKKIL